MVTIRQGLVPGWGEIRQAVPSVLAGEIGPGPAALPTMAVGGHDGLAPVAKMPGWWTVTMCPVSRPHPDRGRFQPGRRCEQRHVRLQTIHGLSASRIRRQSRSVSCFALIDDQIGILRALFLLPDPSRVGIEVKFSSIIKNPDRSVYKWEIIILPQILKISSEFISTRVRKIARRG